MAVALTRRAELLALYAPVWFTWWLAEWRSKRAAEVRSALATGRPMNRMLLTGVVLLGAALGVTEFWLRIR